MLTSEEALSELREAVRHGRLKIRKHAWERMGERDTTHPGGIHAKDVEEAVLTAKQAVWQPDKGTWKVTGGKDLEGDSLNLVCALEPEPRVCSVLA